MRDSWCQDFSVLFQICSEYTENEQERVFVLLFFGDISETKRAVKRSTGGKLTIYKKYARVIPSTSIVHKYKIHCTVNVEMQRRSGECTWRENMQQSALSDSPPCFCQMCGGRSSSSSSSSWLLSFNLGGSLCSTINRQWFWTD